MLYRAANNFLVQISAEHYEPGLHVCAQCLDGILAATGIASVAIEQDDRRRDLSVDAQEVSYGLERPQHIKTILNREEARGGIP
ncbi:MAG TPA: hypothetical protein VIJ39_03855 [Solirubrobacteraceae bacterium]